MSTDMHDYVIVGGGSAGSVVAGRLADTGADVVLLEAGGTDRRPDVVIPAGVISVYKTANWRYVPEPDPSRDGSTEAWPAGRILGGGGSINATVFVRGNPADFDSWAEAGAKGWDYASVLPYFRRLENWNGAPSQYRGAGGPIDVGEHTMHHAANTEFVQAAQQAGHSWNPDYNGATQDGVGHVQVNQGRGVRSSASRRHLREGGGRRKADVRLHALGYRILFDRNRAVGVEYRRRGTSERVYARHEVIVSTGSIASPRLLMLSGIGPTDELKKHNIDIHTVLPGVGHNLQEHPAVMQRWSTSMATLNTISARTGLRMLAEYARQRTGPLAATVFHEQVMHKTRDNLAAPDIQIAFANFATTREIDNNGAMKVKPSREAGFLVSTLFLHPRARGRILLRSNSSTARPVIEHSLLGIPDDVRDIIAGMAEARRIMAHAPINAHVGDMFEPENRCHTDEDWLRFTEQNVTYGAHPVGTCKMGVDEMAVVDPELRVHGVEGLRVIDASVIPTSPTGNTNAPTMMIGERGGDLILGNALR
ncbi:GMC family oxidoreductase [Mycobacterium arosiense]|uniref:Choline dehydrogenase n=1 Tax=Mycobacterium arosiense ATCC BAA-1401 = DSM 45069 TaxID=1265311 RepID=A0A1W9ZBZ0_MYCAI|nr:GMC family oxidoreductase N-terminal domain-containing protein [Mycobacterium arosiense]ORA11664.1 choline dehydrogenase [Mycobacterium arosiense ATCC BAA-1401 = DSM 45069]